MRIKDYFKNNVKSISINAAHDDVVHISVEKVMGSDGIKPKQSINTITIQTQAREEKVKLYMQLLEDQKQVKKEELVGILTELKREDINISIVSGGVLKELTIFSSE